MSRKLKHIILWVPVLVVLLHSFTPHHHHFVTQYKTVVAAAHHCPNSFLSEFFRVDLGSHHLEDFSISDGDVDLAATSFFLLITSVFLLALRLRPDAIEYVVEEDDRVSSQFHFLYVGLRAPPAFLS